MPDKVKISDRALLLLHIVGSETKRNAETGELEAFFLPATQVGGAYFVRFRGNDLSFDIWGGGDASALKGLERAGLIERPRTSLPNKYVYAITDGGLKVLADNWELFE